MKKTPMNQSALLAAVALAGAVAVPLANASVNPFSNTALSSGFNLEHAQDTKSGGAEGKCGDASKCPEGKCGEGKCGEKCGEKEHSDAISGEQHKSAEGKCGEGKCGENMEADEAAEKSGEEKAAK
jgi:uncharacterized low-complexity protein